MKKKNNNHFISKFQLKRFISDPPQKRAGKYFVWVYSKARAPELKNVDHAGSEFQFFGSVDDRLENSFADHESRYGHVYKRIIDDGIDANEFSDELSDLIWLFGFRTKALRERMRKSLISTIQGAANKTNTNVAKSYFERKLFQKIDDEISSRLRGVGQLERILLLNDPEFKAKTTQMKIMARALIDASHLSKMFTQQVNEMLPLLASVEALDAGHNDILQDFLDSGGKCPEKIRPFRWCTVKSERVGLVLGDSGAFVVGPDNNISPFVGAGLQYREVYLPLSPGICIVGINHSDTPSLSDDEIRRGIISTSYEHFFASTDSSDLSSLCASLGLQDGLISEAEVDELTSSIWNRM